VLLPHGRQVKSREIVKHIIAKLMGLADLGKGVPLVPCLTLHSCQPISLCPDWLTKLSAPVETNLPHQFATHYAAQ